jgi:hypothetical protein
MSAALISSPGTTGAPFNSSAPLAGRLSMRTALSVWPRSASLNAESLACKMTLVSSASAMVLSALFGGVLLPTLIVSVAVSLAPFGSVTV